MEPEEEMRASVTFLRGMTPLPASSVPSTAPGRHDLGQRSVTRGWTVLSRACLPLGGHTQILHKGAGLSQKWPTPAPVGPGGFRKGCQAWKQFLFAPFTAGSGRMWPPDQAQSCGTPVAHPPYPPRCSSISGTNAQGSCNGSW